MSIKKFILPIFYVEAHSRDNLLGFLQNINKLKMHARWTCYVAPHVGHVMLHLK